MYCIELFSSNLAPLFLIFLFKWRNYISSSYVICHCKIFKSVSHLAGSEIASGLFTLWHKRKHKHRHKHKNSMCEVGHRKKRMRWKAVCMSAYACACVKGWIRLSSLFNLLISLMCRERENPQRVVWVALPCAVHFGRRELYGEVSWHIVQIRVRVSRYNLKTCSHTAKWKMPFGAGSGGQAELDGNVCWISCEYFTLRW